MADDRTPDRSIAEIIGWVRCARCQSRPHWNIDDGAWGQERPIDQEPTVDDMLAWLGEHGHTIEDVYDSSMLPPGPHVPRERYAFVLGDELGAVYADSLHALFSAAVRAVAGTD